MSRSSFMSLKTPLLSDIEGIDLKDVCVVVDTAVDPAVNPDVNPDVVASKTSQPTSTVSMKKTSETFETFKEYIVGLPKNQLHCFETRNGVNANGELLPSAHRNYLNYLYKFDKKDGSSFFITFRKEIRRDDVFAWYEMTLSKLDESPERCRAVGLKYYENAVDGKCIKLDLVCVNETFESPFRYSRAHYFKNEFYSDDFNFEVNEPGSLRRRLWMQGMDPDTKIDDSAQNMIITKEHNEGVLNEGILSKVRSKVRNYMNKELLKELLKQINEAIEEIKKVNYDDVLHAVKNIQDLAEHFEELKSIHKELTLMQDEPLREQHSTPTLPELKAKISENEKEQEHVRVEMSRLRQHNFTQEGDATVDTVDTDGPAAAPNKRMTDAEYEKWLIQHKFNIAKSLRNLGGGSTRKNKYMSRNTSRKRRLYRKKSRKGKKAYKKLRSRKITRK